MNKKEINPLDNIVIDGGFTAIFRTVGFIGDSLSSGEHESFMNGQIGYYDYFEYSWGQFLARKCGFTAYNFSRGGLTCKTFLDYAEENNVFCAEKACQAYVVALCVNDVTGLIDGTAYPHGFGEDLGRSLDVDTFTGAYRTIIEKILLLEPQARIFVMTPPIQDGDEEKRSILYDKVSEFLRKLKDEYKFLYVIDLRKHAPKYDEEFHKKYYCGGHLNAMGYKYTADIVGTYIDFIIRENYEDFNQVAFIGKKEFNENYPRR